MKVLVKCVIGVMFTIGMVFTLGILCSFSKYWAYLVLNNGFICSVLLLLVTFLLGYMMYEMLKIEIFDKI